MSELCEPFMYQEVNDEREPVTPTNLLLSASASLLSEWIGDVHLIATPPYTETRNYNLNLNYTTTEAKMVAYGGNKGRIIKDVPWEGILFRPQVTNRGFWHYNQRYANEERTVLADPAQLFDAQGPLDTTLSD